MKSSKVDFSAQFGGRDAAAAVLPHFRALKESCSKLRLTGFPFQELVFILRVDGEISQYYSSGAGNIDVDARGKYLSIDIGITLEDRLRIVDVISRAILSGVDLIRVMPKPVSGDVDYHSLVECLSELIMLYKGSVAPPDATAG